MAQSHAIAPGLLPELVRGQLNAIIADLQGWGAVLPAAPRGENSIFIVMGAPNKMYQVQAGLWVQVFP